MEQQNAILIVDNIKIYGKVIIKDKTITFDGRHFFIKRPLKDPLKTIFLKLQKNEKADIITNGIESRDIGNLISFGLSYHGSIGKKSVTTTHIFNNKE